MTALWKFKKNSVFIYFPIADQTYVSRVYCIADRFFFFLHHWATGETKSCFSNKVLKSGWLKTIHVYCLIILEAKSSNQGVSRARLPLKSGRKNTFLILLVSGVCRQSLPFPGLYMYYSYLPPCHMLAESSRGILLPESMFQLPSYY